jgi:hypothetical protein
MTQTVLEIKYIIGYLDIDRVSGGLKTFLAIISCIVALRSSYVE